MAELVSDGRLEQLAAKPAAKYIPTLNGWRAVAVLLVIAAHSSTMLQNSGTKIGSVLAVAFYRGVGVDLFFALSGYLICTLLLREKSRYGSINLAAFYTRRAFRILPPLLIYLSVISVLFFRGIITEIDPQEIVASALFFRNYVTGSWYTGHFWSLAIEEHFYLFVPFIFFAFSWRNTLRIAISIVVLCAVIRLAEFLWLQNVIVEFRTESRIDAIMYGAILALLLNDQRSQELIRRYLAARNLTVISAIGLALLVFIPIMPVRRTLVAILLPMYIGFTVTRPSSLLGRALEVPIISWIGKISYSLYIWQMLFFVPTDRPLGLLQNFPEAFMAVLTCATASYYLVEKPAIKLGHAIAGRN
jgi:peptidoglycan/LPS O-acetylase OafA/YrhL